METYKLTVKVVEVHIGTRQTDEKQNVRAKKRKWQKIFRRDPQFII